jgi:hypothetical protein
VVKVYLLLKKLRRKNETKYLKGSVGKKKRKGLGMIKEQFVIVLEVEKDSYLYLMRKRSYASNLTWTPDIEFARKFMDARPALETNQYTLSRSKVMKLTTTKELSDVE